VNNLLSPLEEEAVDRISLSTIKGCEAGQWRPNMTVKGWWYTPNSTVSIVLLFQLVKVVLFHPVWWVSNYSMQAAFRYPT